MKMLISAVTWDAALKAGMPQADLAALAAELGCQGVELRQYWRDIAAETPAVAAALTGRSLACAYAVNTGLLADSRESTLATLAAAGDDLAVAAALDAQVLRVNLAAGPFDPAFIAAPWWRQAVDALLAKAEAHRIPIAVENGPDPAKSDIALFADLFTRVPSPWLRLTFDTGNWLYAGASPEAALERLAPTSATSTSRTSSPLPPASATATPAPAASTCAAWPAASPAAATTASSSSSSPAAATPPAACGPASPTSPAKS